MLNLTHTKIMWKNQFLDVCRIDVTNAYFRAFRAFLLSSIFYGEHHKKDPHIQNDASQQQISSKVFAIKNITPYSVCNTSSLSIVMLLLTGPTKAAATAAITILVGLMNEHPVPVQSSTGGRGSSSQAPIPVLEVIKIYGKLAGPDCYGQHAPKGSSCQITLKDIDQVFLQTPGTVVEIDSNKVLHSSVLSQRTFQERLNEAQFQWPLKPFGVSDVKSLSKTATMNKGAETRIYMDQLERRGLYDPHNPTGPLPTSLRPKLNELLQNEPIESASIRRVFQALGGGEEKEADVIHIEALRSIFQTPMDYYGFLEVLGKDSVVWPP